MSQPDEFDDIDAVSDVAADQPASAPIGNPMMHQEERSSAFLGMVSKIAVAVVVIGSAAFYLTRSSDVPTAIAQSPLPPQQEQTNPNSMPFPAPAEAPSPVAAAAEAPMALPPPETPAVSPALPAPVQPSEPVASADEFRVEPIKQPAPVAENAVPPSQPDTVSMQPAPVSVPATVPVPDSTVEQRLSTLESKIEAIQGQMVTKSDLDALDLGKGRRSASADTNVSNSDYRSEDAPAKPVVKKKKIKHTSTRPASVRWKLRAAKPGMAWISESATGPLRSVAVGDTVPGLGRITSVHKDSMGSWTVNATKGRISQ